MNAQPADLDVLHKNIAHTGLKVTQQRLVILKAMYEIETHPSAENLHKYLLKKNPTLSLGTVYKNLETLNEKGLIRKVYCADGIKRYDVRTEPHSHLHCSDSNRIIDFIDTELETLILNYLKDRQINNFEVQDVQLQINGRIINPEKGFQNQ